MVYPPAPAHPGPSQQHRRTTDIVATAILGAVQIVVTMFALLWSLLFPMAADVCSSSNDDCVDDVLGALIYPVTWGGIVLGAATAVLGVTFAVIRRRLMFVWPLLGIALVIGATAAGLFLTDAAVNP